MSPSLVRSKKTSSLKSYSGLKASQISFPLGGIGSGSIGLGGDGRLIDWEIFNRPAKGSRNGFTHFAVRAVAKGKLLDARALCGELSPPYMGVGPGPFSGFGYGPASATMAGFPNFRETTFRAEFPFATLDFRDAHFPGSVRLTAFNPFIPLNDFDSSLPAAFFEIEFENPTALAIDYTAAFTVTNPSRKSTNRPRTRRGLTFIHLTNTEHLADAPGFGDLTVATDATDTRSQANWYRGGWCDHLEVFWHDFASPNRLSTRSYDEPGNNDSATLSASVRVRPRTKGRLRFVLAWNYPNCVNYWTTPAENAAPRPGWKNFYATQFADSTKSASYALQNWDRLHRDSATFSTALHASTLPAPLLESVSANLSILKSPTVLRLEDGSFYGWEGVHSNAGSCEGTCTHVWNYAYALPFLFPKLERSIRDLNLKYNLRADGGLNFRLQLPLCSPCPDTRPCCDGQFGDIIKFHRDWKISGDTKWMRQLWPSVKKSLEFAWASENEDRWDSGKTGVLHGRQHHTLDMELFGPNSWLTGFYHAALKAGSELAETAGDHDSAREYREIFERGRSWVAKNLFNGQWFIQQLDLSDKTILEPFRDATNIYWNAEHREIKYQLGDGISIDQVVAQWHANLSGLGRIFDPAQTRAALKSAFRHNYKPSLREVANPWRLYSLYDEAGVLICTWPTGTAKPIIPVPYNSETMYGFEYSLAALMIQEGLVKEGVEIVTQCRRRFTGDRRNPWNEFECGSNYARSLASYSLLNAWSGFEFDASRGLVGFSPCVPDVPFRSFWSLDSGWGTVEFLPHAMKLHLLHGSLKIQEIRSNRFRSVKSVQLGKKRIPFQFTSATIQWAKPLKLSAGQTLEIAF